MMKHIQHLADAGHPETLLREHQGACAVTEFSCQLPRIFAENVLDSCCGKQTTRDLAVLSRGRREQHTSFGVRTGLRHDTSSLSVPGVVGTLRDFDGNTRENAAELSQRLGQTNSIRSEAQA